MFIIQRLKLQPTPRTVALAHTEAGAMATGEASVAGAVFNVPELLDSILGHINMADLIAARRVNKAFYRLIETSPTLQRKLFLRPNNDPPDYLACPYNGSPERLVVPPGSPSSEVLWGTSNIIARFNPCLTINRSHFWECPSSQHDGLVGPLTLLDSAKIKTQVLSSKTWPDMYLTSPPCTGVIIKFLYTEDFSYHHLIRLSVARSLYDPAGVTFATLWEALQKEGDVVVFRDYKPASEAVLDFERMTNTTVSHQIDLHRRKGIGISLNEEHSVVEAFSIAVLAAETEGGGFDRNNNGGWGKVQDIKE